MIAEEEYAALKAAHLERKLGRESEGERSACLVAVCAAAEVRQGAGSRRGRGEREDRDRGERQG